MQNPNEVLDLIKKAAEQHREEREATAEGQIRHIDAVVGQLSALSVPGVVRSPDFTR